MSMRKRIKDPRMDILRKHILSSGVRKEEVARKIGVTVRTVYNWMEGRGKISPLASGPLDSFLESVKFERKGPSEPFATADGTQQGVSGK